MAALAALRGGRRAAPLLWSSPTPAASSGAAFAGTARALSSTAREGSHFARERDRALSTMMRRQTVVDQPRIALLAEIRNEPGLPQFCPSAPPPPHPVRARPRLRAGTRQFVAVSGFAAFELGAPRRRALQAAEAV